VPSGDAVRPRSDDDDETFTQAVAECADRIELGRRYGNVGIELKSLRLRRTQLAHVTLERIPEFQSGDVDRADLRKARSKMLSSSPRSPAGSACQASSAVNERIGAVSTAIVRKISSTANCALRRRAEPGALV